MLQSQLSSHAPNAATHLPTPSTPPTLYVFLILLFCTSPPDLQCFILPTSVLFLTVLLSPFSVEQCKPSLSQKAIRIQLLDINISRFTKGFGGC